MKPLSTQQRQRFERMFQEHPDVAGEIIDGLKQRGYDTSGLSSPLMIGEELAAFAAGVPQGATYGVMDTKDYGRDAYRLPEDIPVVGGEQPSRIAGDILGGALTGGWIFKQGYKRLGLPAAKMVVDKMGFKGAAATAARRGAAYAGAAAPEAVVAATAEAIRDGDMDNFGKNLALWGGIGMVSTPLGRKLDKLWKRRQAARAASNEIDVDAVDEEIKLLGPHIEDEAEQMVTRGEVSFISTSYGNIPNDPQSIRVIDQMVSGRINYLQARLGDRKLPHDEKMLFYDEMVDLLEQESVINEALGRAQREFDAAHPAIQQLPIGPELYPEGPMLSPEDIPSMRPVSESETVRRFTNQVPPDIESPPIEVYQQAMNSTRPPRGAERPETPKANVEEFNARIEGAQRELRDTAAAAAEGSPTKSMYARGNEAGVQMVSVQDELSDLVRRRDTLQKDSFEGVTTEAVEKGIADLNRQIDRIRSRGSAGVEPDQATDFYRGRWVTTARSSQQMAPVVLNDTEGVFYINDAAISRRWQDNNLNPVRKSRVRLSQRTFDTEENYTRFMMEYVRQQRLMPKKVWEQVRDPESLESYQEAMLHRAMTHFRRRNSTVSDDKGERLFKVDASVVSETSERMRPSVRSGTAEPNDPIEGATDLWDTYDEKTKQKLREAAVREKIHSLRAENEAEQLIPWKGEYTDPMTGEAVQFLEWAPDAEAAKRKFIDRWEATRAPLPDGAERLPFNNEGLLAEAAEKVGRNTPGRATPVVKNLKSVRAVEAAELEGEGINVLPINWLDGTNKHYGNPFNLKSKRESEVNRVVRMYREWLEGSAHKDIEPARREWILRQIDDGALDGQTLLYYNEHAKKGIASHADALAEFVAARRPAQKAGIPVERDGGNRIGSATSNQVMRKARPDKQYSWLITEAADRDIEQLGLGKWKPDLRKGGKTKKGVERNVARAESKANNPTSDRVNELNREHPFVDSDVVNDRFDRLWEYGERQRSERFRTAAEATAFGKELIDKILLSEGFTSTYKTLKATLNNAIKQASTLIQLERMMDADVWAGLKQGDFWDLRRKFELKVHEIRKAAPKPQLQRELDEVAARRESRGNVLWQRSSVGDMVTITTRRRFTKGGVQDELQAQRKDIVKKYKRVKDQFTRPEDAEQLQRVQLEEAQELRALDEQIEAGAYPTRQTTNPDGTITSSEVRERMTRKGSRNSVRGVVGEITSEYITIDGRKYTKDKWYVSANTTAGPSARGGAPSMGEQQLATDESMNMISRLMTEINSLRVDISPRAAIPDDLTESQAKLLIERLEDAKALAEAKRYNQLHSEFNQAVREGYVYKEGRYDDLDGPPIEWQAYANGLTDADLAEDVSVIYANLSLGSPHGRVFGMGRNKLTGAGVRFNIRKIEEKQARLATWQQKWQEVRSLLGMPDGIEQLEGAAASVVSRMRGQVSSMDKARQQMYKLAEVLQAKVKTDEQIAWLKQGNNQMAYNLYRELMSDVADDVGLPKGRRIENYIHILFADKPGEHRLKMITDRMSGRDRDLVERFVGDSSSDESLEGLLKAIAAGDYRAQGRGWRAMRSRTSPDSEATVLDLDLITDVYLNGAAEHWFHRQVDDVNWHVMDRLLSYNMRGGKSTIKKQWGEYVSHLYGEPTTSRKKFAESVASSQLFNRAFDRIIGYVGIGDSDGIYAAFQKLRTENPDPTEAFSILDQWEEIIRSRHPLTGELEFPMRKQPVEYMRTKAAYALNEMREALADPNRSGPAANQLYRLQVMSKLGLNFAHGLINTTQTFTNVWPLLGKKYTADGITDYVFNSRNPNAKIHGRSVQLLLEESGVLMDAGRHSEFTDLRPGMFLKKIQDTVMWPSQVSEEFNRGVSYLGAYRKFMDQGVGHDMAHIRALELTQDAHHPFNRAGTVPIMRGPMMRLLLMFKSYFIHQTEFSLGMVKDFKDAAKEKGFRQALQDGDADTLGRHLLAYLVLYGASTQLPLIEDTNLYERIKHPLHEQFSEARENAPRYGPMSGLPKLLAGPFVDTMNSLGMVLIFLAQMQVDEAAEAFSQGMGNFFTPAFVRNLASGKHEFRSLMGLDPYKRKGGGDIATPRVMNKMGFKSSMQLPVSSQR